MAIHLAVLKMILLKILYPGQGYHKSRISLDMSSFWASVWHPGSFSKIGNLSRFLSQWTLDNVSKVCVDIYYRKKNESHNPKSQAMVATYWRYFLNHMKSCSASGFARIKCEHFRRPRVWEID